MGVQSFGSILPGGQAHMRLCMASIALLQSVIIKHETLADKFVQYAGPHWLKSVARWILTLTIKALATKSLFSCTISRFSLILSLKASRMRLR